jgi:hypothetical protein
VETVNSLEAIDVVGVLPLGSVIAGPFDEVLEFTCSAKEARVQYTVDEIFFFAIDFHRRGWGYLLAGEGVISSVLQQ